MKKSLLIIVILFLVNSVLSLNPSCSRSIGSCDWYTSCLDSSTPNCPFINNTMKKKCNEFKQLESTLSPLGQKWSNHVRSCLQNRLVSETLSGGSATCKRATANFFDFHSNCYFRGSISFCQLPWADQLKIVMSGADMVFSKHALDTLKIAAEIKKYCL